MSNTDTQRLNYLEAMELDPDSDEHYPFLVVSMSGGLCYGPDYRTAIDIAMDHDREAGIIEREAQP